MGKRGERPLKELYDLTETISEAEMTPVLEGNCRIQGPVDESDRKQLQRLNSGLFLVGKKFTTMSESHLMRTEPGTCNVCYAPCSSCMHVNRTLSAMEPNTECGFSGSTCGTKGDSFSFIGIDRMPTYKSRICDDSQHAASESSNLLSASSGHDSYSENAESKTTLKHVVACDAAEDVEPLIVPSVETIEDDCVQKKRNVTADGSPLSNSHTTSDFCPRGPFSTREDEQRELECYEDNISCISGVRDSSISAADHNLGNKDVAHCSVSTTNLLPEGMNNEVQIEAADIVTENEESQSNRRRPTWSKGTLDHNGTSHAALSYKSGLAEFDFPNNKHSPKVESLGCGSPSGYLSCQIGVIKELEAPVKIAKPCLETANDTDIGFSSDQFMKGKQSELPSSLVDAPSRMQGNEQPEPIMEGGHSESEIELDVKVCDICGDAGREDLLAICSRCSDGAEHIYCMRGKVRKLPERDWLCGECHPNEETKNKEDRQLKKETENKEHTSETASGKTEDFKHKDSKNKKVDKSETESGTLRECKVKDATGNKIVREIKDDTGNKIEGKTETKSLKQSLLNETSHKLLRKSNSMVSRKIEKKLIYPDGTPKVMQSLQPSSIRYENSREFISRTSKRTGDTILENDSPRKKIALLHNSSFKDTGKARPANLLSSSHGTKAFSRSQSLLGSDTSNGQGLLQPRLCPLSRSSSFNNINARPKVKQLSEDVPIKPKMTRESASMESRKKSLVRSLSKSKSFKSGSSGHSSIVNTIKTQFIHQSRVEDRRGMKQVKEKNVMEKNSSITDHVPSNPVPSAGATISIPKLDMKVAQNYSKLKNTSESNVLGMNKGSDVPNSLGGDEAKKRSIYSSKNVGGASFSGKCNTEDQRACQNTKESSRGTSNAIDKIYSNVDAERGILQSAEITYRDDKAKDISIFSGSGKVISNGSRILRCQRCNETGHATQFCSINKLKSSALKPSAEIYSRDGNIKGNKWKNAVEATITKSRIQKNNSQPKEQEVIPVCSADLSFDVTTNHQETLRKSEANPTKRAHSMDLGQEAPKPVPPVEVSSSPLFADLNAIVAVSDELNIKPPLHNLPYQASILSSPSRTSAMPELDFIWQGSLEVLTNGRDPELFEGIQAHLSSCASPKVRDLAIKFSSRAHLEEVSCNSTWPWEFQAIGPKEENIALFLFAKDVESYKRSYSRLLENMIKKDLALRGNLDGVDVLIYPSNKLPLNTQRWNSLFYLWAVFRGRSTDFSKSTPSPHKKSSGPITNVDPLVQDLPSSLSSVVPPPQKAVLVENTENESPRRVKSPKSKLLKSSACMDASAILPSKFEGKMSDVCESPLCHSADQSAADSVLPVGYVSSSLPVSDPLGNMNWMPNLVTHPESRLVTSGSSSSYLQVKTDETYLGNFGSHHDGKPILDQSVHVHKNFEEQSLTGASPANSSDCRQGIESCRSEKKLDKDIFMKSEAIFYDDARGNQMKMDHLCWEKRPNRKRAHSCSIETVSQVSGETSKSIDDTTAWMDKANYLPIEDEREQKRLCHDQGHHGSDLTEETLYPAQSSKVYPLANLLNNGACEDMPDSSRSNERCFFPVEPSRVRTSGLDNIIDVLSSDDDDTPEASAPNLELALGDKKRPPKLETMSLLFKSAERKASQQKPPVLAEGAEDDIAASLALSLASPASKAVKPVLKLEQLTPDMPHVNTSLLLFGGFTGT